MSRPTVEVLFYFTDTATATGRLVLDDTTRGVLDDALYTLGGDSGSDVASDTNSISIRRGRPSQIFDTIDTGTCRVDLNNEDRTYDPLYAAGPWYGNLRPGKHVQVIANGVTVYDGKVADWDLKYDTSGRSVATAECEDGLATLGRTFFDDWTATASQTAGPRLDAILNRSEVAWSGGARDLDTGVTILQGDAVSWGSNVLNYCQLVAKSDLGAFFASRENVLTFRDRHANLVSTPVVAFADDGTGVAFQRVGIQNGSETFYTRVTVDRAGGTVQSADAGEQVDDGVRTLALAGLLMNTDAQALDMAEYLATTYATGDPRISSISVMLDSTRLSATEILNVLSLEINDLITVTWTPNGVGDPIEQTCVVQGITHEIFPDQYEVSLSLGKLDGRTPFILDDATNGALDGVGVLTF